MLKKTAWIVLSAVLFGTVAGTVMTGIQIASSGMVSQFFAIVASDEDTVKAEGEALPPPEPFPGEKIPETFPQAADIPAPSTDVSEIVEEAMPTVVAVASTAVYQTPDYGYSWFFGGGSQSYEVPSSGSGIIIGKNDTENVEVTKYGEPVVPDFEIPYHTEIMERFNGIDLDSARRVAGNGFYYLMGDIARLHEAVLAYGRDFMIDKGFTYCIPPFMIHGNVVEGVMSQTDMDAMMYKIEGEDLYLIGTSEHTMIGRFIDQTLDEATLPLTLTSYSPCFRKEKGAHGIEERGIYRIHQFEKQEMIVVCRPEESADWYEKLWKMSVELFRSMEIPVRQLNCCSGDLADLKVKSCDIEAWSPRQQKYFEVCSCSNLGDAQARRLHIRIKGKDGKTYLAHTLNNTCVAPPRMLIAFLENHLQADGSVTIPEVLQPYMGGLKVMVPTHKKG